MKPRRFTTAIQPGELTTNGMARRWVAAADPWADACKMEVVRYDYRPKGEVLDRGVNFFVLMLEHLGARPRFSCEGHPNGFYVEFRASHELASEIAAVGLFAVEILMSGEDCWALRLRDERCGSKRRCDERRRAKLCLAARAWVRAFLCLRHREVAP